MIMDTKDMPEEVVTQILLTLPVKCLLKFRCVCKSWFALIRSPRFIDMHLHHPHTSRNNNGTDAYLLLKRGETNKNNTTLLSLYSLGVGDDEDGESLLRMAAPDFLAFPHRMMDIAGPCNGGIVCLAACSDYLYNPFPLPPENCGPFEDAIYLCNPATRESWRLPDRPFGFPSGFLCQRHGFAFGFDPCTHEYKVFSILFFQDKMDFLDSDYCGHFKIEIYNSNSNSWRVPDIIIMPPTRGGFVSKALRFIGTGLFLNGCCHWCACVGDDNTILYLDMTRDDDDDDDEVLVFREMPYPPAAIGIDDQERIRECVVALEDSLALVQIQYKGPIVSASVSCEQMLETRMVIWVMMEYGVGESWMKSFCIEPFTAGILGSPVPLTCWNVEKLFIQTGEGELASCDLLELELEEDNHHHQQQQQLNKKHGINIFGYVGDPWMEAVILHKESLVNFSLLRLTSDQEA